MYQLGFVMRLMIMFEGTYQEVRLLHILLATWKTYLHENVSDIKDTQTCGILCIAELQILLQTLQSCSSHVVAIEIVHDIDQDEQRASCVEFSLHRFLDDFATLRIHWRMLTVEGLNRRLLEVEVVAATLLDVVVHGCKKESKVG